MLIGFSAEPVGTHNLNIRNIAGSVRFLSSRLGTSVPYRSVDMKNKTLLKRTRLTLELASVVTILVGLAASIQASAQTITTFDAPGAGAGPGQGTSALNINPDGTIVGFTGDSNNARHAFIRSKDGDFTVFDAPGAGTGNFQGTRAYAINPDGTITGFFFDSVTVAHGYVRSDQGVITVFDAPGAGTGPGQGTIVFSPEILNNEGEIAGHYIDSGGVGHGFLRDENGAITTFDAPGAGTGPGQGTFSFAISQR